MYLGQFRVSSSSGKDWGKFMINTLIRRSSSEGCDRASDSEVPAFTVDIASGLEGHVANPRTYFF